jgi:hypothetical protein
VPRFITASDDTVMDVDSRLGEALARASASLDAAAGSSSLCSLSRSGVPMPGIKYPEGAWAALREVKRAGRAGGDLAERASAVRAKWQADLASHEQRGSGPDWIAYLTGGVDALDGLLDAD